MTKEEIIKSALKFLVQKQTEQGSWGFSDDNDDEVSWNEAIEWLKQEPCEDCVKREPVQKAIKDMLFWIKGGNRGNADYFIVDRIEEIIEEIIDELDIDNLPSVQPQPKRGEWIRADGDTDYTIWECDQCGCNIYSETEYDRKKFHAWCGMCGAKMDADMKESEDEG